MKEPRTSQDKKNQKNIFGYFGIAIVWVFPVGFVIISTSNSDGNVIGLLNLIGLISISLLIVFPSLLTTFLILQQYSTQLTDFGITRGFLWISTILYWSDVESVQSTMFIITLKTRKKSHRVNLVLYKHPDEVFEFINKNIELLKTTPT